MQKGNKEFTSEILLVTKPEQSWSVTTAKRLLDFFLAYKNVEKRVNVKENMSKNISPFSYILIIKIKLYFKIENQHFLIPAL